MFLTVWAVKLCNCFSLTKRTVTFIKVWVYHVVEHMVLFACNVLDQAIFLHFKRNTVLETVHTQANSANLIMENNT